MDRFYIGRKIIDLLSRKMLITSIALFNWMSPRSGTVDYQVALTYAGTTLRRNGRPPTAQSGNSMMSCPSYPAESSTTVFAVRFKKQKQYTFLSSLNDAIRMDDKTDAGNQDHPYRFTGKCVTSSCFHWTGESCHLGAAVSSVRIRKKNDDYCAIRPTCRWYAENFYDACATCSYIRYSTLLNSVNIGLSN